MLAILPKIAIETTLFGGWLGCVRGNFDERTSDAKIANPHFLTQREELKAKSQGAFGLVSTRYRFTPYSRTKVQTLSMRIGSSFQT
jgi:hypothetical protein